MKIFTQHSVTSVERERPASKSLLHQLKKGLWMGTLASFLAYGLPATQLRSDELPSPRLPYWTGFATYRATWFSIPVYDLTLRAESPALTQKELLQSPWSATLRFRRELSFEVVSESFRKSLADNCSTPCPEELKALENLLGQSSFKLAEGSVLYFRAAGSFVEITETLRNATWTLQAPRMSEAFLQIWIGPHPPSEGFKRDLLRELTP